MAFRKRINFQLSLLRYLIAGGISYIAEIGLIIILVNLTSLSDVTTVAISFWVGLCTSFFLQKIFVFSSSTTKKKTIRQLMLYLVLVAVNYAFTLSFIALFSSTLDVTVARTIALIITTSWNFVLYGKLIFKDEKDSILSR